MKRLYLGANLAVGVLTWAVGSYSWSQQAPAGQTAAGAVSAANQGGSGQAAESTPASRPGRRPQFNGFAENPFFTDPGAQQQLQLNAAQAAQLNRAYRNAFDLYQRGLQSLPPDLSDAERQQRLQELQSRFNQNYGRAVDSMFTNPRLRQRFDQLNWQFQGVGAFNDAQLQQQMNLTPEQQQQFAAMTDQWNQQLQQLRQLAASNPALANQRFARLQGQFGNQMSGVLTPQQQQMWPQMMGRPYNFPPAAYFRTGPGTAPSGGVADPQALQIQTGGTAQAAPAGATGVPGGGTGTSPGVGSSGSGTGGGTGGGAGGTGSGQ